MRSGFGVFRRLCLLSLLVLFACSRDDAASAGARAATGLERLVLRYQGFTGMVSYHELAEDLGYLAPLRLEYVGNTISGPQDIQTVVTRDVDFGGAFNGGGCVRLGSRARPAHSVLHTRRAYSKLPRVDQHRPRLRARYPGEPGWPPAATK